MSLTSYRAAPPRGENGLASGAVLCRRDAVLGGVSGVWIGRPGGDLLSRALRHSTMGAGGFHGRVREGIGCGPPAKATRSSGPYGASSVGGRRAGCRSEVLVVCAGRGMRDVVGRRAVRLGTAGD
jgi:hypothetical protein